MDKEKKTYISGIYNYCDGWCEKCQFTSNCYLFTTQSRIASHEILNNGELPKAEDIFKKEDFYDENDDGENNDFFDNDDFDIGDDIPDFDDDEDVDDFSLGDLEEERKNRRDFFETNKTLLE